MARYEESDAAELLEVAEPQDDDLFASNRSCLGSRSVALGLMLAALVCAAVLLWPTSAISVRQLLEGPEVAEIVTDNVLAAAQWRGGPVLSNAIDRAALKAEAVAGLSQFSRRLSEQFPDDGSLDRPQLTLQLRKTVLQSLRVLGDRRVQNLGRRVALDIDQALQAPDLTSATHKLAELISPQLEGIRRLRMELIPQELLDIQDEEVQERGRRLTAGAASVAPEPELDAIKRQGHSVYNTVQQLAKKYGLPLPNLKKDIDKVDMTGLMTCIKAELSTQRLGSLTGCGLEFAQTAMHVMESTRQDPAVQGMDLKSKAFKEASKVSENLLSAITNGYKSLKGDLQSSKLLHPVVSDQPGPLDTLG